MVGKLVKLIGPSIGTNSCLCVSAFVCLCVCVGVLGVCGGVGVIANYIKHFFHNCPGKNRAGNIKRMHELRVLKIILQSAHPVSGRHHLTQTIIRTTHSHITAVKMV